jgi:hypothetical protein
MRAPSDATRPRMALSPTKAGSLDHTRVGAEIKALERLGFDELRLQWRNRWGRLAPARLTRSLLYRLMVYRIQAEAFGNLDREIKRMLERLADQAPADPSLANADPADAASRTGASASSSIGNIAPLVLKPGALLTREWQGRIERVMVLEEGFAWNGKTYASVSAVAFAITGVKWNGRRFFFGAGDRGSGEGGGGRPKTCIRFQSVGPGIQLVLDRHR